MTVLSDVDDAREAPAQDIIVDVLVIGAGFSGMLMLRHIRALGRSVQVLEAGSDVGGTWYWNRYPGARTDSESWYYCFSTDQDLLQEWDWQERYPGQPEMMAYLRHLSDRYDLRRDIQLNTYVTKAIYQPSDQTWTVESRDGRRWRARFLVTGIGILSEPYLPNFKGIEQFGGQWYQTGRWPKHSPDFSGKRVGIIGTGATGIQAIPVLAEQAGHLTVFQRTANFVVPAHNHVISDEQRRAIKADYAEIWRKAKNHVFGMPFQPTGLMAATSLADERERIFEDGWQRGGFRYLFETFDDLLTDHEANAAAADFIRRKIRQIVKDPETAERLCPKGYPYATKRPPAGHFYYEAFNRSNVSLVDVREDRIVEITPTGIRTQSQHIELDVIVFATGFDVFTGAFTAIDIIGETGGTLREKFARGPSTYLGLATHGFPNLFMVNGPLCPFANMPLTIEATADAVRDCLALAFSSGCSRVEVKRQAEQDWVNEVIAFGDMTLVPEGSKANSWLTGANIPGKAQMVSVYMGGLPRFSEKCAAEAQNGFPNFLMS